MRNSINNITQFYNNNFSLSTKRVHVFLINFDLFNSDDFKEFLSNDEINRANKIKIVEKRHQFIISRGVVKKLLSTLLRKEADQIEFLYSQHGKPFINEKYYNHAIEFNISHSGIYSLIAITLDNKIGVDIQKTSWPVLPVFDVMQSIGNVDENEMFRAFNMGIGIVFIVSPNDVKAVQDILKDLTTVYRIGSTISGSRKLIMG